MSDDGYGHSGVHCTVRCALCRGRSSFRDRRPVATADEVEAPVNEVGAHDGHHIRRSSDLDGAVRLRPTVSADRPSTANDADRDETTGDGPAINVSVPVPTPPLLPPTPQETRQLPDHHR